MFIFVATAMNNILKGKAKYILASLVLVLFIKVTPGNTKASFEPVQFDKNLTTDTIPTGLPDSIVSKKNPSATFSDSIPITKNDSAAINDSMMVVVDTFNVKVSNDTLDAPVVYHADDSMVLDIPGKKILLYGKESKVKYTDNELTAPGIQFDQSTNMVTAFLRKDSTGKVISFPSFNQGDLKTVSDTIAFNMKTGKGLTKGTYT